MRGSDRWVAWLPVWVGAVAALAAAMVGTEWLLFEWLWKPDQLWEGGRRGVAVVLGAGLAAMLLILYVLRRSARLLIAAALLGIGVFVVGAIVLDEAVLEAHPGSCPPPPYSDGVLGCLTLFSGESLDTTFWREWSVLIGGLLTAVCAGLRLYFHAALPRPTSRATSAAMATAPSIPE
jgi:sugar phosphate permease